MLGETAAGFLRTVVPFSLLDEPTRTRLVEGLALQVYPAGAEILRCGQPAAGALFVIREGVVKLFVRNAGGEEQVLDFRSAGDTFGFLALDEGQPLDASVQALSDTVCYVVQPSAVRRLLETAPELREYLTPAYFPKREDDAPWAARARVFPGGGADKTIFTTPVGDLARPDVLAVGPDVPVAVAARTMQTHRVGALVVVDATGLPVGIVTNTDLRDKVLVAGRPPESPLSEIMSRQPLALQARDLCFEALLKMISRGVHHLLVLDGERLAGVLSSHDFLVLQGTTPFLIAQEIEGQASVEGLAASARRITGLVTTLLREGAGAGSIIRVVSAVNDQIERRMLELALNVLGPAPVPFCWLVYGSAGRREQTFMTDQDNAIVYRDPANDGEAAAARAYFARFAQFVVDAFVRCGFALCRGNFMAINPSWRQPLGGWKRLFRDWIRVPVGPAVSNAVNLFDFRGVYGDLRLAAELRDDLQEALADQTQLLNAMVEHAADFSAPIGLFGQLIVEKDREHANLLDVKKRCLMPLVNVVRIFSFESRIPETSTLERLAVLAGIHPVVGAVGRDLAHGFEFLSLLRIRHQHEQIALNLDPDNFIQPGKLSSLDQRTLKQVCRLIAQVVAGIQKKYRTLHSHSL